MYRSGTGCEYIYPILYSLRSYRWLIFCFPLGLAGSFSKHGASTDSGTKITADYIDKILNEEAKKVKGVPEGQLETARKYMSAQVSHL